MTDREGISLYVRNARLDELDEVSRLISDAYKEYEQFFPSWAWKTYFQNVMDVRSRLGLAELIVAELDERLIGAVSLYLDASRSLQEGWPPGWAGIRVLAVDPNYRGRGIGRRLMEECLRCCRERGIVAVALHTNEAMAVARRMYEHMGFMRVPEFDFHPMPGVVVMAYRLDL